MTDEELEILRDAETAAAKKLVSVERTWRRLADKVQNWRNIDVGSE